MSTLPLNPYMCALVGLKRFLRLSKLFQDLPLKLVSYRAGVLLQEVGAQVTSCRLEVPDRVVQLGYGVAFQSALTRVLDLRIDILRDRDQKDSV